MFMKSKFLGSTRFFYAPADKPGAGDAQVDDNDTNDDAGEGEGEEEADAKEGAEDGGDADEGDGDASEGDDEASEDDEPDADATRAEKADWRDKQLAKQHGKLKALERREAELAAENETLRALAEGRDPKTPVPSKKAAATSADPDPVATAKQQIRNEDEQKKYDDDCNKVFADGVKRYPKSFETLIKRLPVLGGVDIPTMQFVLATDDPVEALRKMASDPDEYERIMDLPLHKRANALAKIGVPPKVERKGTSSAPNPVVPIGRSNSTTKRRIDPADATSDKVSDDEWYEQRERDRAARFAKKNGR